MTNSVIWDRGKEIVLWVVYKDHKRKYACLKTEKVGDIAGDALANFDFWYDDWNVFIGRNRVDQNRQIGFYKRMIRANHNRFEIPSCKINRTSKFGIGRKLNGIER